MARACLCQMVAPKQMAERVRPLAHTAAWNADKPQGS